MGAVSKAIPNFFGGVSQQSQVSRHITQCESLVNGDPSIADGLGMRPNTEHIANLVSLSPNAFVHFINRDANQRYVLIIDGGTFSVYDLNGVAQTSIAPEGLSYLASSNPREDFVAVTVADYTFIVNKQVTVTMDGSVGGGTLTGTVQQFSDLPETPTVGDIYRIEGTPSTNFDDYYVRYDASGVWVETVKPGIQNKLNAATMPWKLIKTGPTQFSLLKNTWADRLVGDEFSNPAPSFVGFTISDVFFHRNRLGFLSDEQVIMSRAGDPFNFWAETVTAALDSDPIDVGASTNKVTLLRYAVPFNKALLIFSDTAQFQLSSGDVLTPKTAKLDPTTEFESSSLAKPVSAGSSLFFAVRRENSTGFREYFVDQDTISNDAADISAHVPSLIPSAVFRLTCSTTKDLLFALSSAAHNRIYAYQYYWSGDEKVQSAWHIWEFPTGSIIHGIEVIGSVLYIVVTRPSGQCALEKMDLERAVTHGGLGFRVHLDRLVSLTGVYDSGNNWTTWTLPYQESGEMTAVLGSAFAENAGNALQITRPSATTVRASGNWTAGVVWIGCNYTFQMRLSRIFLRDDKNVSVIGGKLMLQTISLWLENSGYLRAEVNLLARDPSVYEFTGKEVGSLTIGALSIRDDVFAFPVGGLNTQATIDLINDTYLPCNIIMAEWSGDYVNHKARS